MIIFPLRTAYCMEALCSLVLIGGQMTEMSGHRDKPSSARPLTQEPHPEALDLSSQTFIPSVQLFSQEE